ncbi:MAG TPA: hypothetical protein GXX46_09855 [Peptococcaceae bacterium]|nr:hypothetical protein [Peptococcaceae bacterium]
MSANQTSYLLQKVAPLVMKELGPRLEPIITEKITIPLAKKIGLPLARKIGIPLARKTGTIFLNKVGYPLLQKALSKANINLPNSNQNASGSSNDASAQAQNPEANQSNTQVKRKRKSFGLAKIFQARKAKKSGLFSRRANPADVTPPNRPFPVINNQPVPMGGNPQIPAQTGSDGNFQAPLPNMNNGTAFNNSSPASVNPFDYNHNPSLFGRRRLHSIYDLE